MGAQDDFPFALRFLDETGLKTPNMLWDPSFTTWQAVDVQANSQMMVMSADLEAGSTLVFGFDDEQQSAILDFAANL